MKISALAVLLIGSIAVAQPVYPEGVPVPRGPSPAERHWERTHSPFTPRGPGSPPTGPLLCPGEYEPAEGILLAWEGGSSINSIQRQMVRWITTTGAANAILVFDTTAERDAELPAIQASGAEMSRVVSVVAVTDTQWIRDYGPRYVYEGDCRIISDHIYNRPTRVNDNNFPVVFAELRSQACYAIPLTHGGGNFQLSTMGDGFATQLILTENAGRTAAQIVDLWRNHWGVETTITPAFSTSVDSTQHIDMWMQIIGDRAVVISDWPAAPGTAHDNICDARAAAMAGTGWVVTRVPARQAAGSFGQTHYTYTNVVMCNDLVLMPSYTNSAVAAYNAPALAAWQAACPNKTVIQINCESLVQLAGVMHCIVMHVPAHRGAEGGRSPTAYLREPNGPASFAPGEQVFVRWITDDDQAVVNVDVQLSTDGGATWPLTIAADAADDGEFDWTVPDLSSDRCRVRVVARDADARTGWDGSDADFSITGAMCAADFDQNGFLTGADFDVFVSAFESGEQSADFDADGFLTGLDFDAFVAAFEAGC